jgi:hypothetical protein
VDVTVRSYQPTDRDAIVRLWQECGLVRAANNPFLDIDRKLAHDAENLIVLESAGQLVAAVMVGYDSAEDSSKKPSVASSRPAAPK